MCACGYFTQPRRNFVVCLIYAYIHTYTHTNTKFFFTGIDFPSLETSAHQISGRSDEKKTLYYCTIISQLEIKLLFLHWNFTGSRETWIMGLNVGNSRDLINPLISCKN